MSIFKGQGNILGYKEKLFKSILEEEYYKILLSLKAKEVTAGQQALNNEESRLSKVIISEEESAFVNILTAATNGKKQVEEKEAHKSSEAAKEAFIPGSNFDIIYADFISIVNDKVFADSRGSSAARWEYITAIAGKKHIAEKGKLSEEFNILLNYKKAAAFALQEEFTLATRAFSQAKESLKKILAATPIIQEKAEHIKALGAEIGQEQVKVAAQLKQTEEADKMLDSRPSHALDCYKKSHFLPDFFLAKAEKLQAKPAVAEEFIKHALTLEPTSADSYSILLSIKLARINSESDKAAIYKEAYEKFNQLGDRDGAAHYLVEHARSMLQISGGESTFVMLQPLMQIARDLNPNSRGAREIQDLLNNFCSDSLSSSLDEENEPSLLGDNDAASVQLWDCCWMNCFLAS